MPTTPYSDRNGFSDLRSVIQIDDFDRPTRMAVWNHVYPAVRTDEFGFFPDQDETRLRGETNRLVWCDFYGEAIDELPAAEVIWKRMKLDILDSPLNRVFDLLEIALPGFRYGRGANLASKMNEVFELYLVGHRFIDGHVIQIDSDLQVSGLETALVDASTPGLEGVRRHLEKAIAMLSDRQDPDYPNVVKEAMSSVEAMCEFLTGENQLGKALREFKRLELGVHQSQIDGWRKLYGWSSDENGVRHGSFKIAAVSHSTAKYAVITGAAFISLLIDQARSTGRLAS